MTNIFWMRRDLRLDDNRALYEALQKKQPVRIIFIIDTQILAQLPDKSDRRLQFIINRINHLNQVLNGFHTKIHTYTGKPDEVFKNLLVSEPFEGLFFNRDYEPYALERDSRISRMCMEKGVFVATFKDQVLFEKTEVVKQDNTPYTVFTPYSKTWKRQLQTVGISRYPSEDLLAGIEKSKPEEEGFSAEKAGFCTTATADVVPEISHEIIGHYDKTRNLPYLDGTSRLGHHLRFGTLSIRKLASIALKANETYLNELIWREFFMQILYHFPHVTAGSFKPQYDAIAWENDLSGFQRWKEGTTGFPLVDAGMRELKETGFMHNRVRMVSAGFLVKDLLIDWRLGEAWFAQHLLDYELASNNGNWQWAAGTGCDAAPYFRIFNPTEQQKKFDPEYIYIKKWIPEFGTSRYPSIIVNHTMARKRTLARYKEIFL
ncbi:MAG: deoxyribodipyrimidine photo-lyase [Bacteroidales bacterium]|nr:DNA photolyase family protein [Bacteroidales bacterium]MDD2323123.1 deoxyribodipyrimidine photo-lyase [Bacteroidales bacterium]MDD3011105.1 deoxyribodipyrimidine photo-lyase [Bacteroidales bacterium]MDD3960355.1 deoxyribodipyrimidine photo-lyase [Bacteroidales bacterium]MDY0284957.1 deoxyribodipyrimidine photo-lyase [Bacteroidales bacterium]